MPFVSGRIVIDSHRRGKCYTAIRAAREHHVSPGGVTRRLNTAQHVNIIIRGSTGTVDSQKYLPCQPGRIYIASVPHPTKIDLSDLLEYRRLVTDLCITRPQAPKRNVVEILTADKQIAIRIYIRCAMNDIMGNVDRRWPCHSTVGGTAKSTR